MKTKNMRLTTRTASEPKTPKYPAYIFAQKFQRGLFGKNRDKWFCKRCNQRNIRSNEYEASNGFCPRCEAERTLLKTEAQTRNDAIMRKTTAKKSTKKSQSR